MASYYVNNQPHPASNASGTATGGGSNYILLADGGVQADDLFNGYGIAIVSGSGAGQWRRITDYDYTGHAQGERYAQVNSNWSPVPDATSVYEITVGSNANDGQGSGVHDGTHGAWGTISHACATVPDGEAHVIEVAAGTYPERALNYLDISNGGADLTIQPAPGAEVVLATTGTYGLYVRNNSSTKKVVIRGLTVSPVSGAAGGAVAIGANADEVTLDGLTIRPIQSGIQVDANANATDLRLNIQSCLIHAPTAGSGARFGMVLSDVRRLTIVGCTVHGAAATSSAAAILVSSTYDNVYFCRISGNTVHLGQERGVVVQYHARRVMIDNNLVVSEQVANVGSAISCGLDAGSNANPLDQVIVRDNTVLFNSSARSHGILLGAGSSQALCCGNRVHNADIGIVVKAVTGCVVSHNRVYGPRGILLKGATFCKILFNSVASTADKGALQWSSDGGALADPVHNVVLDNIFDAGASTGYALHNAETLAQHEGHFHNLLDDNAYRAGTGGLALLDRKALQHVADDGDHDGDSLHEQWQGAWSQGGENYWTMNDQHSVQLNAAPFADAAGGDFRIGFFNPCRGSAGVADADRGAVQRPERLTRGNPVNQGMQG